MLGTPIAHEAAASVNLKNVATSATRPTLENRLHDLDAAVASLDHLVESVGNRLSPLLLAAEPAGTGLAAKDASGDSTIVSWLAGTTERLEDVTAVLASIIERVQL